jgi:hypothetical protein
LALFVSPLVYIVDLLIISGYGKIFPTASKVLITLYDISPWSLIITNRSCLKLVEKLIASLVPTNSNPNGIFTPNSGV